MVDEIERAKKHNKQITMSVSFLEIYNEHIYDLLNSALFRRKQVKPTQGGENQPLLLTVPFNSAQMDPTGLKLKWNNNDHYVVENLFTFECQTYEHIL
jgi:Kinesin motor domain